MLRIILFSALIGIFVAGTQAQTTAFTYQGFLKDGATPASGIYNISISLWDAETGGAFINSNTYPSVPVVNGVFTVDLDFGESVFSAGAARWIEVAVRLSGGGSYTTLTPRIRVKSVPWSIQSLNSAKLGGLAADQYVTTNGGGANFIQNTTSPQPASDFNITGSGTAGGTLSANIIRATTQYNIGGLRILSSPGNSNLFAGIDAGFNNTTGVGNSYFGTQAGFSSNGSNNSFFGQFAGNNNSTGSSNTMIGFNANPASSGLTNATAIGADATVSTSNTIALGRSGGQDTVVVPGLLSGSTINAAQQFNIQGNRVLSVAGNSNLFVGVGAGFSNTFAGNGNAFFGASAGPANTTGTSNAFFGSSAGLRNTTGNSNAFFGTTAGQTNTTGTNNTIIGSGANLGVNNLTFATAVGSEAVVSASNAVVLGRITDNVGIGTTTPTERLHVVGNGIVTGNVGIGTTTPGFKLDVADRVRVKQVSGSTGGTNSAGIFFYQNGPATERAFVGMETDNSVGFFGVNGGGWSLAMNTQTGAVKVVNLGSAGSTALCRNASNEISTCSSSLRYKTNIGQFPSGMSFVNKLRPISFDWKDSGMQDVGFGAEDVSKIDPRFVTYNSAGEVEGVKYDRLSVAFVNAFKEQQEQIETLRNTNAGQQEQIDELKKIVCSLKADAEICKTEEKK